jgi:hypothetical protein
MTTAAALQADETVRAGLGPVAERLSARPCSIAYFGASVTVQREGYRPRLHELLRLRFGQDHRSVVAAIGAIGIFSAAFLADELVVRNQPDLCLIEFTTAEFLRRRPLDPAEAALDGILSKLREAGIAVCLLHLPRRKWKQKTAQVLGAFEKVAERHAVPSIDLASPTRRAIEEGSVSADLVFKDVLHTRPDGARLIAGAIDRAIWRIAAADVTGVEPPEPVSRALAHAYVVPAAAADAGGKGRMGRFRLIQPYVEVDAGTPIRRCLDGHLVGLVVLVGPESGEIEVRDPAGAQRTMVWNEDCSFERYTTVEFERPCPPGSEVTIELTDTAPDYSTSLRPVDPPEQRNLRVVGYMVLPE